MLRIICSVLRKDSGNIDEVCNPRTNGIAYAGLRDSNSITEIGSKQAQIWVTTVTLCLYSWYKHV